MTVHRGAPLDVAFLKEEPHLQLLVGLHLYEKCSRRALFPVLRPVCTSAAGKSDTVGCAILFRNETTTGIGAKVVMIMLASWRGVLEEFKGTSADLIASDRKLVCSESLYP